MNLAISQWSFLWAIIISGFGSGSVFVPLSATTVAGLPNEEIGNASGLYNLFRNVGGSIGISVVNTIVARHEQLHQTRAGAFPDAEQPQLPAAGDPAGSTISISRATARWNRCARRMR